MLVSPEELQRAVQALRLGQTIAYPTEAVYGLGCDPNNPDALAQLLSLKVRPEDKGLILIASDIAQIRPFLSPEILPEQLEPAVATWPGPVTWVVPSHPEVQPLLTGHRSTLAIRVSAHPTVQQLCQQFGPLVSTSCNLSGQPPARSAKAVRQQFAPTQVAVVIHAPLGELDRPTAIFDLQSGAKLR